MLQIKQILESDFSLTYKIRQIPNSRSTLR